MKKIFTTIIIIVAFVVAYGICNYYETHYDRKAVVIDIKNDNIVVMEDMTGNIWDYQGIGFRVGDNVKMKMWNHCTDSNIYDDEIENVEKLR